VNPGDEGASVIYSHRCRLSNWHLAVLLMDPFYDAYPAWLTMAGAVPKYVPYSFNASHGTSEAWSIDGAALAAAVTSKTRAIVINNPHNPTGASIARITYHHISVHTPSHYRTLTDVLS
jgi:aspartate/methionine/tyrosine aminotransferase